jgi:hypothetical protein
MHFSVVICESTGAFAAILGLVEIRRNRIESISQMLLPLSTPTAAANCAARSQLLSPRAVIAGEKCRQELKTFKIPQSSQFSGFPRGGLH